MILSDVQNIAQTVTAKLISYIYLYSGFLLLGLSTRFSTSNITCRGEVHSNWIYFISNIYNYMRKGNLRSYYMTMQLV